MTRLIDKFVIRRYAAAIGREAHYAMERGIAQYEAKRAALKNKQHLFADDEFVGRYITGEPCATRIVKELDALIQAVP